MMQPTDASDLIQRTERARRRTRSILRAGWFPLILFGALTIGSASVAEAAPGRVLGLYWLVGAPLATLVTALWYWRREEALGVSGEGRAHVAAGVALLVAASAVGWLGHGEPLGYAAVTLVIGAGYAVFAYLDRSRVMAGFAALLAASAVLFLVAPAHAYAIWAGVMGGSAVLVGLFEASRT